MTDPPEALKGSYKPSPNMTAGSVWSAVGNDGVVRVKLIEDSADNLGDGVRTQVRAAFR